MVKRIEHILAFGVAILLPPINMISRSKNGKFFEDQDLTRWFYSSIILLLSWYFLKFLSKLDSTYKWLVLTGGILVFAFSITVIVRPFLPYYGSTESFRFDLFWKIIVGAVLLLLIQYAVASSKKMGKLALEKEKEATESYKLKLQALRMRVDPHFLYNTLNTLRVMVRKQDPGTENFVLNLSQFYRQTLKTNTNITTSLQEELMVLESYLFLMNERMGGNVKIFHNIDDSWLGYQIPTMSLQILMENCLKHNRVSQEEPMQVHLSVDDEGCLVFKNSLQPKITVVEKSGYGLDSLLKTYEILEKQEGMKVLKTMTTFEVTLKLISNEYTHSRR